MECRSDDWGIDVLVVGSQKALMLPPGLSFLSVSEKAWRQIERTEPQAFYFNLKFHRESLRSGPQTPWTPAVTLVVGLAENLRQIRAAGIEAIWAECERLGRATRAGVQAIGLELFAQRPAAGLTAVKVPAGLDCGAVARSHGEPLRRQVGRRPGQAARQDLPHRPLRRARPTRRAGHAGGARIDADRTGSTRSSLAPRWLPPAENCSSLQNRAIRPRPGGKTRAALNRNRLQNF